tara:strand:- start:430 stop:1335 length:906 start_codon:yes stop_codon:yes gene_type:complete
MNISRKELIRELDEEKLLRENIRKAISLIKAKRKEAVLTEAKAEALEEEKLRKAVRKLILKEVATSDTDPSPHRSTGINVLEDLLKKIIPVLEDDFKILTSNPEQRKSFRAHIINAAKNTIAPIKASENAGQESPDEELQEQDVEVKIGGKKAPEEDEAFIDIRTDQEKAGEEEVEVSAEEEFGQGVSGGDLTGRNMAYSSYKKIEKNILDAYELLSDDEDKELFYDYLVTNLKLYFDKFEDELAGKLEEPTTPEYEATKQEQDAEPVESDTADEDVETEDDEENDLDFEEEEEEEIDLEF